MNARIAASAVSRTGRARCTVASTTAWNGFEPRLLVMMDLANQDQRIAHQDPRQGDQAHQGIDAKRLIEQQQRRDHANQPSGAVRKTMTIADSERTCRIMISSVRAIIIGNNGTIARVALPDSSIDPAVSMR